MTSRIAPRPTQEVIREQTYQRKKTLLSLLGSALICFYTKQWWCGGVNGAVNMAWNEIQIDKPLCDDARETFQMRCNFLRLPDDVCNAMDQVPEELYESARKAQTACKRSAQTQKWHASTRMVQDAFFCGV